MPRRSPLDDPHVAAHAWGRFLRLMRLMMLLTIGVVIVAMVLVYRGSGETSPHFFIATALGVGGTMLLMSTLMGLIFLSSGTGHDEAIEDRLSDEDQSGFDSEGRRR